MRGARQAPMAVLLAGLVAATSVLPTGAWDTSHADATLSLVVLSYNLCTGAPIPGGAVLVANADTKTVQVADTEGRALFYDLAPGDYSVFEQAFGYEPLGGDLQPPLSASIDADAPAVLLQVPLAPLKFLVASVC
jgi:hypothetical protein